jgi:hypothetical protein
MLEAVLRSRKSLRGSVLIGQTGGLAVEIDTLPEFQANATVYL